MQESVNFVLGLLFSFLIRNADALVAFVFKAVFFDEC